MTEIGFNHQLNKLRGFYGEKSFHPERTTIIAAQLKIITDDDFAKICSDIIANSNTPPTLKEFLKVGERILIQRRQEQYERDKALLAASPRCQECDGDGYLTATKNYQGRGYDYSFRCPSNSCLAAKLFTPPNYTKWSSDLEPEFTRKNNRSPFAKSNANTDLNEKVYQKLPVDIGSVLKSVPEGT